MLLNLTIYRILSNFRPGEGGHLPSHTVIDITRKARRHEFDTRKNSNFSQKIQKIRMLRTKLVTGFTLKSLKIKKSENFRKITEGSNIEQPFVQHPTGKRPGAGFCKTGLFSQKTPNF